MLGSILTMARSQKSLMAREIFFITAIVPGKSGENEERFYLQAKKGKLIKDREPTEISVPSRRGLFAKDTAMVLDYLFEAKPLYVRPQASLDALKVANAAEKSSLLGRTVDLN